MSGLTPCRQLRPSSRREHLRASHNGINSNIYGNLQGSHGHANSLRQKLGKIKCHGTSLKIWGGGKLWM